MSGLTLAPFRAENLPALADLWIEAWAPVLPQIDFAARRPWFEEHVAALQNNGAKVICAFDASGLIGFVTIDADQHYIDQIALAPRAQGSGAARRLLEAARALSPHLLLLDVNVDNPRALRFYVREGFYQIGEGISTRSGLKTVKLEWRS
ncbi:GNAT family N-acetyltransferase [Methylovirgula sp. 4M-Z18]|uniref:GNAT family N-acetyltransferase n=1 Tax=Methylovirgula sp. 4M-Z18 TaxID=2293567 RepID=UPI000E2F2C5E|nr:GNAT family N-acetyltransferase [Methylovirgula sp. 4M-Z18]RFB78618.1 GNAT family N-acetyltransferase [Methylovirgula sp. 4M-Z18]